MQSHHVSEHLSVVWPQRTYEGSLGLTGRVDDHRGRYRVDVVSLVKCSFFADFDVLSGDHR